MGLLVQFRAGAVDFSSFHMSLAGLWAIARCQFEIFCARVHVKCGDPALVTLRTDPSFGVGSDPDRTVR